MTQKIRRKSAVLIGIAILSSLLFLFSWMWHSRPGYELDGREAVVEKAFYDKQSDLMVEVTGTVHQLTNQKQSNSRYQEFRMKLPTGQLLTVVHINNPKEWIPLRVGDIVIVRGKYHWSELGGIIKGTQYDNSMVRLHGWVDHKDKRYD